MARLQELAEAKPALLRELGILDDDASLDDLIAVPPRRLRLAALNTGQATLFDNNHLTVHLWTTKAFDFNVKEWSHTFTLKADHRGELADEFEGIRATIEVNGQWSLSDGETVVILPPPSASYSNGHKASGPICGISRFSLNPKRQGWTTGPVVVR